MQADIATKPLASKRIILLMEVMVLVVDMDDLQIAGKQNESNKFISDFSKATKLQKEGPFLTREEAKKFKSS